MSLQVRIMSDLALEMAHGQLQRSGHWPERLAELKAEILRRARVRRGKEAVR